MRRIIGISMFSYDTDGNRTFYLMPDGIKSMRQGTRRVTRTPTLDGAAVVYDAGYSVSDLTWKIPIMATSIYIGNWISMLVKGYNAIRLTTIEGVFLAVPSMWKEEDGVVTLEALVVQQLA